MSQATRSSRAAQLLSALLVLGALALAVPSAAASTTRVLAQLTRLEIVAETPANHAAQVSGTAPIVITFNEPLSRRAPLPSIVPPVAGSWQRLGSRLQFTPSGAYNPDSVVAVLVPGRSSGVHAQGGATLAASSAFSFEVEDGSVLRAQQLLARLGFLPLQFMPRGGWAISQARYEQAVFTPQPGRFLWRFKAPQQLSSLWSRGEVTPMFTGALMSFERSDGLDVDGILSWPTWNALLTAGRSLAAHYDRAGYVYALARQSEPETFDLYLNGREVLHSLANTGISLAPTESGTFPVYLRYRNQTMQGVDPWGHKYKDPVSFVAYFNGSEAVHYFDRASYGFQQSLGCVELPYLAAKTVWPYLQIGTLVTVTA